MSFRGRLRFFFTSMVIVPMIGVAVVLFLLTQESETGKADAAIASGLRNAFVLYGDAAASARPELRQLSQNPGLRAALARGDRAAARREMAADQGADPRVVAIELYGPSRKLVARVGSGNAVAHATLPVTRPGGRRVGALSVSVTRAGQFTRRVARLSGLG